MNFCHFAIKIFRSLCKVEPSEDTTIILITNINGTFFYLKLTFFQTKCLKADFTFCQRREIFNIQAPKFL